tara:strand:+ start:463 stop:882 length:420 start_codon:yes stop_codon:yes gene_type:complete
MINFSINVSEDQKDQIVVETLFTDYFSLSDYAEDLKIKDAIETVLSCWYMPKEKFDKVVSERREESAEKKVNKEKDKQSPYFIDPLQGYKWGFPKNISQENVLGDTMKWLVDNGYPKEVMEEFGKHFKFTIWKEPKKDQ